MNALVVLVVAIPGLLALVSLAVPSGIGRILTAIGGLATAGCIGALAIETARGNASIDAVSALFLLPVAIVYGSIGLYTTWYIRVERIGTDDDERHRRHFLALTNAFACAEALIPLLTNLAGLWVTLEGTTIAAALLVRLHGTAAALEAAWKYILIASCGLAIGLVGIVVLYASAATVLGAHHSPEWAAYLSAARNMNTDGIRLAFVLVLIGFGTKMGLAPMHTWLPDAHGAGPTPTSAMLSGILLSDALYVIVRFTAITNRAVGPGMTHHLFFIVGLLSLFVGAFFLLRQSDIKRMLAYSSIEHMGIVACGLAFGGAFAVTGALLHAINHSATKSLAFMSAGRLAHQFDSRQLSMIRGGVTALPISGTLFALAGLALAGMPPFGPFRSELMILVGGFGSDAWPIAIVMLALLLVAFAGILRWTLSTTAGEPPPEIRRGERDIGAIAGMLLAFVVVLGLGLALPPSLSTLLDRAYHIIEGAS